MDFIQTDRVNNGKKIRAFQITKRSVNTLFSLGETSIRATIFSQDVEYCWLDDGEYCCDREYYIDEDVAYFGYQRIVKVQVNDSLLPCYLMLLKELTFINDYTKANPRVTESR